MYSILRILAALCFIGVVHSYLPSDYGGKSPESSIEESNWVDEKEIRERLSAIAAEKFSHHYHEHQQVENQNVTTATKSRSVIRSAVEKTRRKRDGGIVSGPVATALVTGMIGMTAKTVAELTSFNPRLSEGGCEWFGTAPLCNFPCPSDYDYIRANNGRCSSWWLSGFCSPDPSFGKPCSTILGDYFSKRFCCKSDPMECTWSGRWMGANTAHNIYCRYDNVGKCGTIDCSINHFTLKAQNSSEITGDRCDRLELFGLRGKATCGYIAWFNEEGHIVNSWYKTR
ncbi:hypothetical protein GCK72_014232 [Caenorhabditis remanei]|uniref:Uncharacterized protein n=2 Tax=Caenorhabditis remanei TaxID=31234 RepID=A0A6A5GT63_CAERE|nr:hypothetical protein GCK72_014232 [Caenorhabditis remanei]KAF1757776.1 hypothetical protein GCK72_014232 [Caenorhabditis remanei]